MSPQAAFQHYLDVLTKHYVDFDGRAGQAVYWSFIVVNIVVAIALGVVLGIIAGITGVAAISMLGLLYNLGVLLPTIGLIVRRLHDFGKPGIWAVALIVPLLNLVLVIWAGLQASDPESNDYGPPASAAAPAGE